MPGLYLLMYIERVPNDSTSLVTAVSKPAITEAMSITVMTPIITPVTVREERSLLARNVARASQRFSIMSLRNSFISFQSTDGSKFLRAAPQSGLTALLSRPERVRTAPRRPPILQSHLESRIAKDRSGEKLPS